MFLLQIFGVSPLFALAWVVAIVLAIAIHEAAHSWTAKKLGDPTAQLAGRVTLNPLAHLDPIGTLLIFLVGFGWGRPAPFNPTYFKNYKAGTALVAVAGPLSNLLLLFTFSLALQLTAILGASEVGLFLLVGIIVNLLLAVFNLIPIPPLDGSKILYAFLPGEHEEAFHRLEQLGPLLILGIFLFGAGILFFGILQPALAFIVSAFGLDEAVKSLGIEWVLLRFGIQL